MPTPGPLRRRDIMALALLLVVAVVTRFLWLGRESMWLDEIASLGLAQQLLADGVLSAFEPGRWRDAHPPLYFALLGQWIEQFGTSETALRSLSAVIGVLLVAATWQLGRVIAGKRAAIACALLVATNPLALYYAQEARMYSLVALLMVLATYHWCRLHHRFSAYHAAAYVVLAAVMLYTHYLSAFVIAAHFAWSLSRVRRESARRDLARLVALGGCIGLIYLPWAVVQLPRLTFDGIRWMSAPTSSDLAQSLLDVAGLDEAARDLLGRPSIAYTLCAWLALLVVVAGAIRAWRHGPAARLVVAIGALPLVLVAFSYIWTPVFNTRQASVYTPFAAMLIAFAFGAAGASPRTSDTSRNAAHAAGVATIAAWAAAGAFGCWLTLMQLEKPDWRGLASELSHLPASTPIAIHQSYLVNTFRYYYRGKAPVHAAGHSELGRLGEMTGDAARVILIIAHADPERTINSIDAGYRAGEPRRHTWMRVVELTRR